MIATLGNIILKVQGLFYWLPHAIHRLLQIPWVDISQKASWARSAPTAKSAYKKRPVRSLLASLSLGGNSLG